VKVLLTGANGFIARNLIAHLSAYDDVEVMRFTRENSLTSLPSFVRHADWVFHLAGVNRSQDSRAFKTGNVDLTRALCDALRVSGRCTPIIYTSSSQAVLDNAYGNSKRAAEDVLLAFAAAQGVPVYLYRLPNVFGKWARPDYNSVVATFCHNIAHGLPIQINNANAEIRLVYIDDVIHSFMSLLRGKRFEAPFVDVTPQYRMTLGGLAQQLYAFRDSRQSLITETTGSGLVRALHATYLSYLPPERFVYKVPVFADARGVFVEMLKTKDSGQFSFFTVGPGMVRGGHYHHSKTEKFLVIKGKARFRFRHIMTGEFHEILTHGDLPEIVETVPGWTHDVTNVGDGEMLAMLWANEIFDRSRPDTYARPVDLAPSMED